MVKYTSEGVFDADVDKVWQLLNEEHTPEKITRVHTGIGPVKVIEQAENVLIQEQETKGPDGKPTKQRVKFTMNPPEGFEMEWITGPLKGSRCTHTYIPKGPKTEVALVGDFVVAGLDDRSATKLVDEMMTRAFNEDNAYLKKL